MNVDGNYLAANGSGASVSMTGGGLSTDFNTFLRMLTVQMQNQDPLNPMEASDFAVQLATFSQVEQQVRTNDLLNTLGTRMAVLGMSQLASWIGMEARVVAPVTLPAGPIELFFKSRAIADSAEIVVRNLSGGEVQRIPVGVTDSSTIWDGNGLPRGSYQLELVSYKDGTQVGVDTVGHFSTVREARGADGSVVLVLASGATVDAAAVQAIRGSGL